MRKRTFARELTLQMLYLLDIRGAEAVDYIDGYLKEQTDDPEVASYAKELIMGYWERKEEIDAKIEGVAKNWVLKRMALIDRNVIRMAAYELLFCDDVPAPVVINEAIDIVKKFSSKHSGQFVNGILDNIRIRHAGEDLARIDSRKT